MKAHTDQSIHILPYSIVTVSTIHINLMFLTIFFQYNPSTLTAQNNSLHQFIQVQKDESETPMDQQTTPWYLQYHPKRRLFLFSLIRYQPIESLREAMSITIKPTRRFQHSLHKHQPR